MMHKWNPALEGDARFLAKLGHGEMERLCCFGEIGESRWNRVWIALFEQMVVKRVRNHGTIVIIHCPASKISPHSKEISRRLLNSPHCGNYSAEARKQQGCCEVHGFIRGICITSCSFTG